MTAASQEQRRRLRDLGIAIGRLPTGALNAITDVAGVRVGHATVWRDAPRLSRTGVTAIFPSDDPWTTELFAGTYSFNGCGEFTGWIWLEESGCLTSPICLTGTHSVGAVRDALINIAAERGHPEHWHLGLVGETYDGFLSDGYANAVQKAEVEQALDAATSGAVPEGCVGGGTGMNCHEFKGGIGTASRVVDTAGERYTVGVLVQANYGVREEFAIDGVPIGREIGVDIVPSLRRQAVSNAGSILIIVATDAPLLPHQCKRLAQRATVGLARTGGYGRDGSGDLFLAFSTGNRMPTTGVNFLAKPMPRPPMPCRMLPNQEINPLFNATAEATEEAIANAICMAVTTPGREGRISHALPLDRLQEVWRKHRPAG
jgi:D-aminopeptidase